MAFVDWQLAIATGTRLVPPGPRLPLAQAVATVENLTALAATADAHVARVTGLDPAPGSATTVVVDRPDWIRANVESFQRLAEPLLDAVTAGRAQQLGSVATAVTSRAAGVEVGVMLSYLATRVLGQFELLGPPRAAGADGAPDSDDGGRLSLVAPNIVAAERSMGVDPDDFRLWVCLHEVTHRTQFAAAPWLHGYVEAQLKEFVQAADLDGAALLRRLRSAVTSIGDVVRGRGELSLVEVVQTPEQRVILDRLTGLMSLLEGHADVVMDAVGEQVVPSVAEIRRRFSRRREDTNPIERVVRRLLGVDMKLKQYAEGAAFVRTVIDVVGMPGLNVVWSAADTLPTAAEIRDPQRWLDRVQPPRAVTA